ncbi:hypothetical protein VP01_6656g2, partial [Puccinia sorghi]
TFLSSSEGTPAFHSRWSVILQYLYASQTAENLSHECRRYRCPQELCKCGLLGRVQRQKVRISQPKIPESLIKVFEHFLQKVLVNMCENLRSRMELISTLLGLLQDGTGDAATIDRSFSQVSSRASKALTPVTPKSTTELRRETHRIYHSLSHLTIKSKGKEKSNTSITDPIVGLLALLDPASLFRHPNLTNSITSLLALIGRPLTVLAKKSEEAKNQPAASPVSAATDTTSNRSAARPATTSGARPSQVVTDKSDAPPTTLERAAALAAHDLRMIVNVRDSGERSSKHSLSCLREQNSWVMLYFLNAIREAPNAAELQSTTLAKLSSASAQQSCFVS